MDSKGGHFSRWFKRVGMKAVLYDMGLVSSIYLVMVAMHKDICIIQMGEEILYNTLIFSINFKTNLCSDYCTCSIE